MDADFVRKLEELANAFLPYATLYAVGGCVRDGLLGVECYDVDVCSQLEVKEVKNILLNTDFEVSAKNLRMGTVYITSKDFSVEYTTFRRDSYDKSSGAHSPKDVVFTDDITLDARRRDFACNAVYYDLARHKIVDVIGGVEDIKNKILRTADIPEEVFEADGLRILRLVRFYAELGFEIEPATLKVAKENAWRVGEIAVERVRDELNKIFVADTRHKELDTRNGHVRGFLLLDELGLVDLLLGELVSLKGLEQPKQYHLYDAFGHSVKAFEVAPPHLRWASLLHDVGKAQSVKECGRMYMHPQIGAKMASDICRRLKFSNAERERIVEIVKNHMFDLEGKTSRAKLRKFIVEHRDIIEDLCDFKDIDGLAACGELTRPNRLREELEYMKSEGVPTSVKELCVNGADLVEMGIEGKYRSALLKDLLIETAMNPTLNDRDRSINFLKNKQKTIKIDIK